jgi:hypothetical protein
MPALLARFRTSSQRALLGIHAIKLLKGDSHLVAPLTHCLQAQKIKSQNYCGRGAAFHSAQKRCNYNEDSDHVHVFGDATLRDRGGENTRR